MTAWQACGLAGAWSWIGDRRTGGRATITVPPGTHTINLWMREDGFICDRILLTTDANYVP